MSFSPFKNEQDVFAAGDLTLENRVDRISIIGSTDLTKDKHGLELAKQLHAILGSVISALEAEGPALPDVVAAPDAVIVTKPNPFG